MVRVCTTSVIDAPVAVVWKTIRDFNALPSWVPAIADSRIEDGLPSDRIGCVRNFHTRDGGHLREQLVALSDRDHSFTYVILESPLGVRNYVATLALTLVSDGERTFAEWTAEFDCEAEREAELMELVGQGVFQGGFTRLKEICSAG